MHPGSLRCGSLAYDGYAALAGASRSGRLERRQEPPWKALFCAEPR
jgi:hypothetical protein